MSRCAVTHLARPNVQAHHVPKGARKCILIYSDFIGVHVNTNYRIGHKGMLSHYKLKRLNNLEAPWRSPREHLLPLGRSLNSQTG